MVWRKKSENKERTVIGKNTNEERRTKEREGRTRLGKEERTRGKERIGEGKREEKDVEITEET